MVLWSKSPSYEAENNINSQYLNYVGCYLVVHLVWMTYHVILLSLAGESGLNLYYKCLVFVWYYKSLVYFPHL